MNLEDRAQEHEAQIWAMINRPREVVSYKPDDAGYGPKECVECGAKMPAERRAHGFKKCTPCAAAAERRPGRR